ncbi:uncharacterized protein BCR38DRAFT_485947 [Pseudomassariella vexata]|uniref:Uncharacterized protein n=1 Tax=Pseudomassariella vexata TaxID=1141098 RepID=A0A1Y2DV82_9PEZI|nr:uncharacterized protein BCR38DRAFT_485947 [Pseudomassariella vexata]ORY63181.1 hypothetical protein BCR38DRAFT_485947 [Pseudomassariella vexata]
MQTAREVNCLVAIHLDCQLRNMKTIKESEDQFQTFLLDFSSSAVKSNYKSTDDPDDWHTLARQVELDLAYKPRRVEEKCNGGLSKDDKRESMDEACLDCDSGLPASSRPPGSRLRPPPLSA